MIHHHKPLAYYLYSQPVGALLPPTFSIAKHLGMSEENLSSTFLIDRRFWCQVSGLDTHIDIFALFYLFKLFHSLSS